MSVAKILNAKTSTQTIPAGGQCRVGIASPTGEGFKCLCLINSSREPVKVKLWANGKWKVIAGNASAVCDVGDE